MRHKNTTCNAYNSRIRINFIPMPKYDILPAIISIKMPSELLHCHCNQHQVICEKIGKSYIFSYYHKLMVYALHIPTMSTYRNGL